MYVRVCMCVHAPVPAGSSQQRRMSVYDESKAVSMDLKDTGLSASDQSGDLESGALPLMGLDMAETAEWGS